MTKTMGAQDNMLGIVNFNVGDLFKKTECGGGGSYEGELKLDNVKKGSISVKLRCHKSNCPTPKQNSN